MPFPMPSAGAPPGMPSPPPGGAPPPGMAGGTGGATVPGGMAGASAQGMTALKLGLEALQKALPALPMGSEIHNAVLKAVGDIAKHMENPGGGDQAAIIQQLVAMARDAHAQPGQQAMMRSLMPGGGAPPPPMGGAPPPPM